MNKSSLALLLALAVVCGLSTSVFAQGSPANGTGHVRSFTGQPSYGGPLPPGTTGGPVSNPPEVDTPEHRKEEAEQIKEYCRTHKCGGVVQSYPPGWRESIERAMRASPH